MRGGYGISIDGLESRFEVLNVTNTPHFVNPAANVSNLPGRVDSAHACA
jgi:hypothetical protein